MRHDRPLQRGNEGTSFGHGVPAFRSSFGGQSYHGNGNGGSSQGRQISRNNYSVRDGHAYGAHSGEYFNSESYQNQHRRYNKY